MKYLKTAFLVAAFIFPTIALSGDLEIEAEAGALFVGRNIFKIPPSTGTTTNLRTDDMNPLFAYRFYGTYRFNQNHSIRILVAPFSTSLDLTPAENLVYADTTFEKGVPVTGEYKFNSYRLSYIYSFDPIGKLVPSIGFTAKIRDARIGVTSSTKSEEFTNVGFVPLLNLGLEYGLSDKLKLAFDIDGSVSKYGRAEDLSLKAVYDVDDSLFINGGYRLVEGGADVDTVYNFALFHYLVMGAGYRF